MISLLAIKKQHINLLQKYNTWGKSEEAENLLDVLDVFNIDLENQIEKSKINSLKTTILIDTNEIVSPVCLDYRIELPIVELFIEKDNFVLFTTQHIYNCRGAIVDKIKYIDILSVDENSINDVLRDKTKNVRFFDIQLVLTNHNKVPITIEYGISFRPIVYFLTVINEKIALNKMKR